MLLTVQLNEDLPAGKMLRGSPQWLRRSFSYEPCTSQLLSWSRLLPDANPEIPQ